MAYYEEWASRIKQFVLAKDLYQIQYYLDPQNDNTRRFICTNVYGKSPLLDACALQRYSIVKYFVEVCKANVNICSEDGITPVYMACVLGDVALLEYLQNCGGNIHCVDNNDKTLLMKFVQNASICNVLISRKVDIHLYDRDGKTALDYALSTSSTRTLELLLQNGARVNYPNSSRKYPIEEACLNIDIDSVRILLQYGASVNVKGQNGKTLLMQFINHFDLCKILLQNSIAVNMVDDSGMTAFHYAIVNSNDSKLLTLLLNFRADINAKDKKGLTPAAHAILKRKIDFLTFLLQNGADVHAVDVDNASLLHHAVEVESMDAIKILTEKGTHCNVRNRKGMEPIIIAACRDNIKIVEYFIQLLDVHNISKIHALELLASNRLQYLNRDEAVRFLKSAMDWRLSNKYSFKSEITLVNELFPNINEPTNLDEITGIDDDYTSMQMLAAIIRGRILGSYDLSVLKALEPLTEEEDDLDSNLLIRIMQHINKIAVNEYGELDIKSAIYKKITVNQLCRLDRNDRPINVTLSILSDCSEHVSSVVKCHKTDNQNILKLLFHQCMLLTYLCLMDDTNEMNKHTIETNFEKIISKCPNDDLSKTFIHVVLDNVSSYDIPFEKETFLKFLILLISNRINVSSVDFEGLRDTPLHKFCHCPSQAEKNTDAVHRTVRLLLANGNHICIENRFGVSIFEQLQSLSYPVHEVRDKTLQCLAAERLANGTNINDSELPPHMKTFVSQHEHHYFTGSPSSNSSWDSS